MSASQARRLRVVSPAAPAPIRLIYYGTTRYGHRLHLGQEVLSNGVVVIAYCGNILSALDLDRGWQPTRVSEYCRTCFRKVAWQALEWAAANGWRPA